MSDILDFVFDVLTVLCSGSFQLILLTISCFSLLLIFSFLVRFFRYVI